jgi:PhnB protein
MQINPYIKFNDGKCTEAMNFYQAAIGGELKFMTIKDTPMSKDFPADKQGLVMHSTLTKGGVLFLGSDMMRDVAVVGDNVGISIDCKTEQELRDLFDKLSAGGSVFMKPEDAFWGAVFAMFTDKYGVEWMLNCPKPSAKK